MDTVLQFEQADRKIMNYLRRHGTLDVRTFVMDEGEKNRAIERLTTHEPPLINRIGSSSRYQPSAAGRKFLGMGLDEKPLVYSPPPVVTPRNSHELGPGPRGQLVKLLEQPFSVHELVERTGFKHHQVLYFLRTLEDRALLERHRCETDGRIVKYQLKSALRKEPEKPLLTPALVPLTDQSDWRTWIHRLLVAQFGGPPVKLPKVNAVQEKVSAVAPAAVGPRKKLLILGAGKHGNPTVIHNQLVAEFGHKLDLTFYENIHGSDGLESSIRKADHTIMCCLRSRHSHQIVLRKMSKAGHPYSMVWGATTQLRNKLREFAV